MSWGQIYNKIFLWARADLLLLTISLFPRISGAYHLFKENAMLFMNLLSEEGPNTDLSWLLWWVLGFFFLMVVIGWWQSGKKKPVETPVHEHAESKHK
jgi:hypothetical protein